MGTIHRSPIIAMRQCKICSTLYEDARRTCPGDGSDLPAPDPLLGVVVDKKFQIDSLIGSGGMGSVYRATQIALARSAALKVIRRHSVFDGADAERFRREALAVARLKHEHIVTIYDFGVSAEAGAYIAMEYLEGRTLAEAVAAGPLSIDSALEIGRQICSAVHAAHEAGVVHRDLKPQNIFLERSIEGERVKVLDFGIARLDAMDAASLTGEGGILGTPLYMSPEQCEDGGGDERSDQYGVGCLVYEMLTGKPPFVANTIPSLLLKKVTQQPEPPSRRVEGISEEIEAAVMIALARDPRARHESVSEFGRAIEAVIRIRRERYATLPAGTPIAHRTNLPPQVTAYVGRERELALVGDLLATARMVTLAGPGGIGKTRLALEVARRMSGDFPGGVWFLELDSVRDPAFVPHALASVVGAREDAQSSIEDSLVEAIGAGRALLLVDNCEHVVDACADLVRALTRRCGRLTVVATSRETLRVDGESVVRVPPLVVPERVEERDVEGAMASEAVQLLVDRIRLRNTSFQVTADNAAALARLCRQLEGIPLAIELAAARAHVLSLDQIVARLGDRFRFLSTTNRASLARQRTLLAAIDWSHDLLSEEERALFRRLSVFARGWTLAAAEVVAGDPAGLLAADDVLDLLERLVDKSLVSVTERDGDVRYRMLETLREYGREKLRAAGEEDEAHVRHLRWGIELAERARELLGAVEQAADLDAVEREHDNFRAMLAWSVSERRAPDLGLELCAWLSNFWAVRGHAREGKGWIDAALALATDAPSLALCRANLAASRLAYYLGEIAEMRARAEVALRDARMLGDETIVAHALNRLGVAFIVLGEFAEADAALAEQASIHARRDERLALAQARERVGMLRVFEGRYVESRDSYGEALKVYRDVGATRQLGPCLLNIAEAEFYLGELDAAARHLDESLAVSRRMSFQVSTAYALFVYGNVTIDQGDFATARRLLAEAMELSLAIGEARCQAHTLEAFARGAVEQGHFERALTLSGAAAALREAHQAPLPPAERAYLERSWARAREALGEERSAAREREGRRLSAEAAGALARTNDERTS
jgi:predicted ATPase/serine/threonine protein kinase